MDLGTLVARRGGVVRRSELLAAGFPRRAIDTAVDAGVLTRPFPGVLSVPGASRDEQCAAYFRGRPTCVTALEQYGVRLLAKPSGPHVEVAASGPSSGARLARENHVRLHRSREFVPGHGPVSVARALDMMSRCGTVVSQLVALDHALGMRLIRASDVEDFSLTSLRDRVWLRRHADPASESVPETCARAALQAAGLRVESQVALGGGKRADFLVEGRLFVEIDGQAYHSGSKQFDADRRRDRRLSARGFRVVRFTYADAVYRREKLVADVVAVLAAPVRGVARL